MTATPEPGARRFPLWLALGLAPFVVLAGLALNEHPVTLPSDFYLPLHVAFEIAMSSVALATFAVQWLAGGTQMFREARARFLGASFLGMGLLELFHLLVFPGMPGFLGPASVDRGIFYWFAARTWILAALLAVLWLKPESESPFLHRRWLVPGALALVAALVVLETSLPVDRAWFFVAGEGLTPVKVGYEWALAAASFSGAFLASRRGRSIPGEGPLSKISVAFVFLGVAELCFSLYRHPHDLLNMAGHAYLAVGFWFLFDALFVAALLRPYRALEALRAHVEDELVVTIRRLERMREQREDFLRAVSHDLRNPLQVVLLQADRISRVAPDDARLRRPVAAIRFAGRRMERMLRDLTDAARLEGGGLRLAREPVELRPFVEHLLELEQGVLDSGRVENRVDPALPPLDVDPDRLDRILVNLLGNALKYADGPVRIGGALDGDAVRITVEDRGAGIPAADLERLFERYYRGHRHEGEGLGLGLFIVKGLVEAHGGRIQVASTEGVGTTFTIHLPLARVPGDAAQRTAAP